MSEMANQIVMTAPPDVVFQTVSRLEDWAGYLPHYRWVRAKERNPDHLILDMACYRGWIPIAWTSRFSCDSRTRKLRFEHLSSATQGMEVYWHLEPLGAGGQSTDVTITHDLRGVEARWGKFFAHQIIGKFFINHVAARTLRAFAAYFQNPGSVQGFPTCKAEAGLERSENP
jgi:ribosome-associated toxin RatA of RatAB toxin-antitoxin module